MIPVFCTSICIRALGGKLFVDADSLVGLTALSRVAMLSIMSRHKQSLSANGDSINEANKSIQKHHSPKTASRYAVYVTLITSHSPSAQYLGTQL